MIALRRSSLALLGLFLSASLQATVRIFPTFSEPMVLSDTLVFASPNSDRLIATDLQGRKLWERRLGKHDSYDRYDSEQILLQRGTRVSLLNVRSLGERRLGRVAGKQRVWIDPEERLVVSESSDFSKPRFAVHDFASLQILWSRSDIQSLEAMTSDTLFVVVTKRHYERGGGSYSVSDGTLVALDRRTGAERWRLKLHDENGWVRARICDSRLVRIDGLSPSLLRMVDPRTGTSLFRELSSDSFTSHFNDLACEEDHVLLLESHGGSGDVLRTVRLDDLSTLDALPVPAKENIFFHRIGDVVLTSGIYSIAAFDRASREKKWEIKDQRLLGSPIGPSVYASYNDDARNRAVLERIDLATGEEHELYAEPLPPPSQPTRNQLRARERYEREEAKEKERTRKREAALRPKIGAELCLRYDQSGMADIKEYLRLRRDGSAEYIDADVNFPPLRMRGTWTRAGDVYSLTIPPLVRDLHVDDLHVLVGIEANVALLPDLRDAINGYLQTHLDETSFSPDVLSLLRVWAPGCGREALSYCDAQGGRGVEPATYSFDQGVSRDALEKLTLEIDRYLASDFRTIRFTLKTYRAYVFANFLDPHSIWDGEFSEALIDNDIAVAKHHPGHEPSLFRAMPCAEYGAVISRVGKIEEYDPQQK
jgi:hypothetical protein